MSYQQRPPMDPYPPPGYPSPYNAPPPPPGYPGYPPPPPRPPYEGYQQYFNEGYYPSPPPPPPPPPQYYHTEHNRYGDNQNECGSFLKGCLAALCCCCVLEECFFCL